MEIELSTFQKSIIFDVLRMFGLSTRETASLNLFGIHNYSNIAKMLRDLDQYQVELKKWEQNKPKFAVLNIRIAEEGSEISV